MELKKRRFTYIIFFVAFFLIAPIIILYSEGYRPDFVNYRLVKLGAIFVKSYPGDALISTNGKTTRHRTPHQILNLLPGENIINVSKDGYHNWEKVIEIESGRTTFVEDILLFKADFKAQSSDINNADYLTGPDGLQLLILGSDWQLRKFDPLTNNSVLITQLPVNSVLRQWSPAGDKFVYTVDKQWWVLDLGNLERLNIDKFASAEISMAKIDDNNKIWILSANRLSYLDDQTGPATVFANDVNDFLLSKNNIITLSTDWKLQTIDGQHRSLTGDFLQLLPQSKLLDHRDGITLIQQANEISVATAEGIEEKLSASHFDWSGNSLLLSNDFEIWRYDIGSDSAQLIDRTGQKMDKVIWHPSRSYFARLQNGKLEIVEIDSRGAKRHVTFIADLPADADFYFDTKGENIYTLTNQQATQYKIQ